jgi:hypothetical protein
MGRVIAGGLLVTVAIAGVQVAAASGSSTIHACAAKSNGALRVAKHCTRHERAVSWSQRGPAGLSGKPGAPGKAGAAAGYTSIIDNDQGVAISDDNAYHNVISLTLPAGSYVVTYSFELYNSSTTATFGSCRINTPTSFEYDSYALPAAAPGGETSAQPSGTYGVLAPSGGSTVSVACNSENVPIGAMRPTMSAVQVATLN